MGSGVRAYMPVFVGDWLADADVQLMSLAEEGAYFRLLCYQWREGAIPTDLQQLGRLLRVSPEEAAHVWETVGKHFEPNGSGRARNARLERERRAALRRHRERVRSGRKGAKTRHIKRLRRVAEPEAELPAEPEAQHKQSPSPSPSPSGGDVGQYSGVGGSASGGNTTLPPVALARSRERASGEGQSPDEQREQRDARGPDWPEELREVREECQRLGIFKHYPKADDPEWWASIEHSCEGTAVFYLDELAKAWNWLTGRPKNQRWKNFKTGFTRWINRELEREAMRAAKEAHWRRFGR